MTTTVQINQQQIPSGTVEIEPLCCCNSMKSGTGVIAIAISFICLYILNIVLTGVFSGGVLNFIASAIGILMCILGIVGATQENAIMIFVFGGWMILSSILYFVSMILSIVALASGINAAPVATFIVALILFILGVYFSFVIIKYGRYLKSRRSLNQPAMVAVTPAPYTQPQTVVIR